MVGRQLGMSVQDSGSHPTFLAHHSTRGVLLNLDMRFLFSVTKLFVVDS